MKKTGPDLRSIYMSVYRTAAFIVVLSLLSAKMIPAAKSLTDSFADIGALTGLSGSVSGIIVIFMQFVIFEAVLAVGEYFGAKRLFAGALIFMSAVLFILLTRFELQWYIPAALVPWLLLRLICRNKKSRYIFIAALALTAILLVQRNTISRAGSAALIFLVITELAGLKYEDRSIWIPYYLILSVVLMLMPVSKKPFDWNRIITAVQKAEQTVDDMLTNLYYYVGSPGVKDGKNAGYSGMGRTGSGISSSSREELRLTGRFKGTLYLAGVSFEKLKNTGWSGRVETPEPYNGWFIEWLDMLYKNNVTKEEAALFSEMDKTGIEYRYIRTADLIHPVKTILLTKDIVSEMTGKTGDFRLGKKKGKGSSYDVMWLAADYGAPEVNDMLCKRNGDPLTSYEVLNKYCADIYHFELSHFVSEEDYVNYIDRRDDPLKEPGLLDTGMATDRMKELAASVTEGLDHDFEKAAAIEAYLRQYEYDRNADHSKEKNFVDSFLFENKNGYCVHYASAMVELLRLSGIRARLSEGYAVSCDGDRRVTTVRSESSHAWPEAYLEGLGWVVFEPTANRPSVLNNGWERSGAKGAANAYKPAPPKIPETQETEEESEPEEQKGFFEKYGDMLRLAACALLLLVIYLIVYLFARILLKRLRYSRRDDEGKIVANVRALREVIARTYSGDWENASLMKFGRVFKGEDRELAKRVFEGYYRVRFSGGSGKTDHKIPGGLRKKPFKESTEAGDLRASEGDKTSGYDRELKELCVCSEELLKSASTEYIKNGHGHFRRMRVIAGL